jgi:hypothetical protein
MGLSTALSQAVRFIMRKRRAKRLDRVRRSFIASLSLRFIRTIYNSAKVVRNFFLHFLKDNFPKLPIEFRYHH